MRKKTTEGDGSAKGDAPLQLTKREQNRRDNLRAVIESWEDKGGLKALAKKLGYANPSFISQMTGPNPTRVVTDRSARKFEETLGLEEGSLDWPPRRGKDKATPAHSVQERRPTYEVSGAAAAPAGDTPASIAAIRLMARVCADAEISLPPLQFADAVALVLETSMPQTPENYRRIAELVAKKGE